MSEGERASLFFWWVVVLVYSTLVPMGVIVNHANWMFDMSPWNFFLAVSCGGIGGFLFLFRRKLLQAYETKDE